MVAARPERVLLGSPEVGPLQYRLTLVVAGQTCDNGRSHDVRL